MAKSSSKSSGKSFAKAALALNAAVVCPAVASVVGPILAEQFPSLTLVGITVEVDAGQPHLWVALEETACGFQPQPLTPEQLAALPKIALDTCEAVSRAINDAVDALPQLADVAYNLDVGSPGAFRQLVTDTELAFYTGWPVALTEGGNTKTGKGKPVATVGHLSFSSAEGVATITPASGQAVTVTLQQLAEGTQHLELNPTLPKS